MEEKSFLQTVAKAVCGFLSIGLIDMGTAHASEMAATHTACYRFQSSNNPFSAQIQRTTSEVWCYQNLTHPAGSIFIYNADQEKVVPELAMVVDATGLITHASISAGEMTLHRVHSAQFNPFTVPLKEPVDIMPDAIGENPELTPSAKEVLSLLLTKASPLESLMISEGKFTVSVPANALPWRGYWWPYKGQPMVTPLSKYDRYVRARTGISPRAANWEAGNHVDKGIWWEGHCNGWAASSILRAEPKVAKKDPVSGVTFSVPDLKGILAATDYCTQTAFFGSRNRGRAIDNPRDIFPEQFHKTITYYIGSLGKSVAMDYHSDPVVDNHVISGYQMGIQRIDSDSFSVVTKLTVHKYDGARNHTPGVAPSYTRTYRYHLNTDAAGNVISGSWKSANPDFLWVPLSSMDCDNNNPRIDHAWVAQIMAF